MVGLLLARPPISANPEPVDDGSCACPGTLEQEEVDRQYEGSHPDRRDVGDAERARSRGLRTVIVMRPEKDTVFHDEVSAEKSPGDEECHDKQFDDQDHEIGGGCRRRRLCTMAGTAVGTVGGKMLRYRICTGPISTRLYLVEAGVCPIIPSHGHGLAPVSGIGVETRRVDPRGHLSSRVPFSLGPPHQPRAPGEHFHGYGSLPAPGG